MKADRGRAKETKKRKNVGSLESAEIENQDRTDFSNFIVLLLRAGLFIVSISFFGAGFCLIGVGFYLANHIPDLDLVLAESRFTYCCAAVIVAGALTMTMAACGIAAAVTDIKWILVVCLASLCGVALYEIAAGFVITSEVNYLAMNLGEFLVDKFDEVVRNEDKKLTLEWNQFQAKYNCCGIHTGEDYEKRGKFPPTTCCLMNMKDPACAETLQNLRPGCFIFIYKRVRRIFSYLQLFLFLGGIAKVSGLVFVVLILAEKERYIDFG